MYLKTRIPKARLVSYICAIIATVIYSFITTHTPVETQSGLAPVVKVVDGDTIDVIENNTKERVRLIGINTPETVDPRRPVQCFGKEASNKAKEVLTGAQVRLESDSTQSNRDKYGRLLRYIFLEDGTNFNLMMVHEGFAHEYTYEIPYIYQKEFKEAEAYARTNKLGLWGSLCNGKY